MVYEDENESAASSAGQKINQWHWEMALIATSRVLCAQLCRRSLSMKTLRTLHIVKNIFESKATQPNKCIIHTLEC